MAAEEMRILVQDKKRGSSRTSLWKRRNSILFFFKPSEFRERERETTVERDDRQNLRLF